MNQEDRDQLTRIINQAKKEKMPREENLRKQYEYEVIQIIPGAIVFESELDTLGERGFRLVGIVPLTQALYKDGEPSHIAAGTNLIFERRKEIE